MSGVWAVLPTYNERENLEPFVRALLEALETVHREGSAGGVTLSDEHHVLVVDDNSPDGTGAIADRLAAELEPVEVLHRERKEGLGRAYLAGFAYALDRGADLVMEMDSDFSHDPRDVPRLIEAASHADLVLGSRYVPGGGVEDWGLLRRFVSRGGSWYARRVLRLPVRDLTGGFKCFRREVLAALDLSGVHADGYGFQIELTYRAIKSGFRVVEVPITFRNRRAGESKMHARIALEAAWKVPALRRRGEAASARANVSEQRADEEETWQARSSR